MIQPNPSPKLMRDMTRDEQQALMTTVVRAAEKICPPDAQRFILLVVEDTGKVQYASGFPPSTAARMFRELAEKMEAGNWMPEGKYDLGPEPHPDTEDP